ncbi:MAG: EAL domain-containing protein [Rhizobiaceae bacterium]|nr:MAG: EAL domain-containing protein [Rhizobiaceae bacterium]CAG0973962.1 putative signaling protein [Rhizobiaceae bacterium]
MSSIHATLIDLGTSKDWLIAANFILSVLLGLWMLRYRALYIASRDTQSNYHDLIDNLSEGVYRSTLDGRQLSANKALVRLNGYANEAEMLAGVSDIGREWYVEPGRRDEFRRILQRDGHIEDFVSEIYRHKTRERIWVSESARLVRDKRSGKPLYCEGSVREVTETLKRLNLEAQFRKLTSELPGALFQFVSYTGRTSDVIYASAGLERITGHPVAEFIARPTLFGDIVAEADIDAFRESMQTAAATGSGWDHEFRIVDRDGREKWVRVTATPEIGDSNITWHGYLTDISVRKRYEMEIEELAFFDPLTKLPNRRLFMRRMTQAITGCAARGDNDVLLFIDLDNFKTLNDTQGHDTGDAFLIQVAERLRQCVSAKDLVARIGGDEFVIIIDEAGDDTARATRRGIGAAGQVLAALHDPFELGELNHIASASVGVVVFDGAEQRPDELLKRADIAMYQAKAAGRNGMALFDPATMDRETERYRLLSDLRKAFTRKELELHYQVQVDDTGNAVGAEGLLRWSHPELGMVYPDRFIPLAEQFGLNDELTRYVLDAGVGALAGWQSNPETANLRLSLNVSVQSFNTDDFAGRLAEIIGAHGVDASKLTLELTEHVMAQNHEHVAGRMAEVKKLGVRLSLDDFGTGYSSLAYLKTLPLDEVKVDGGFIADIEHSESNRALVKTILVMARNLGLNAVAEHVENVRQEAFLRAFGCDFFQGYLYGRAMPADAFLAYVAESRGKGPRHLEPMRQSA